MPRIAHVISSPRGIGGAERIVAELATEGCARGWDQMVLNPFQAESDHELAALCPGVYEGVVCDQLPRLPAARRWLRARLKGFRPDVIHVHLFHAVALVASLPRSDAGWRLLTHHHGDTLHAQGRRLEEQIDRVAARRYDVIIAVSDHVKRFLVSTYGLPAPDIICIRNGWRRGASAASGRRSERPVVVCVANLRPGKGHRTLLTAFSRVRARVPDAQLVLVGGGPCIAELRALVAALDLSHHVTFAGAVADVWPYLERAHVFALPSDHEALGIAVLEAMAARLPVVASDVGGIPELVKPGITGEVVAAGDDAAFADRIVALLTSPDMAERMGEAGGKAAAEITMQRTVERYFELYSGLLEERAGKASSCAG